MFALAVAAALCAAVSPLPEVAAIMPAVAPPTAITAPDAHAAVFRDILRTVNPPILRACSKSCVRRIDYIA
jgi:hypothetical protein